MKKKGTTNKFNSLAETLEHVPEKMAISKLTIEIAFGDPTTFTRGDLHEVIASIANGAKTAGVKEGHATITVQDATTKPARKRAKQ